MCSIVRMILQASSQHGINASEGWINLCNSPGSSSCVATGELIAPTISIEVDPPSLKWFDALHERNPCGLSVIHCLILCSIFVRISKRLWYNAALFSPRRAMAQSIRPVVSLFGISLIACGIVYAVHQQQTDERQVNPFSRCLERARHQYRLLHAISTCAENERWASTRCQAL